MPLEVIVVGGGIAGLSVAIALRQAGHHIKVYEKSEWLSETGAAVSLSPNGTRVLSSWNFSHERASAVELPVFESVDGISLEQLSSMDVSNSVRDHGGPFESVHRVDLHNELRRLAQDGHDNPVSLHLGKAVQKVTWTSDKACLTLADGTCIEGDLIVAADGVHSTIRKEMLGNDNPVHTGMSAFRMLVLTAELENSHDDNVQEMLRWKSPGATVFADTTEVVRERHAVWYACRAGQVQNLVGIHPTRPNDDDAFFDPAKCLEDEFKHFHPGLRAVFKHARDVKTWPLPYYAPLRNWIRGNVVLVGDAAHTMLPFGAQAANQAIEDAGALGRLLRDVSDSNSIKRRLQLFQSIRLERTSVIQVLSSVRIGREKDIQPELWRHAGPATKTLPSTLKERLDYCFDFDILNECDKVLEKERCNG